MEKKNSEENFLFKIKYPLNNKNKDYIKYSGFECNERSTSSKTGTFYIHKDIEVINYLIYIVDGKHAQKSKGK